VTAAGDEARAGGEAPCRAGEISDQTLVDLDDVECVGSASSGDGVVWSLPHGGDLDANLVRIGPGGGVGAHVNDEVDVLIVVRGGTGEVTIGELRHPVRAGVAMSIVKGVRRSLAAGPDGLEYLSIHRRRGPLDIGRRA
jgi:quercetin dioxygenase-like cupin family protein